MSLISIVLYNLLLIKDYKFLRWKGQEVDVQTKL